ncbi:MAG TPA: ABC transporter ATP-binding protein [Euzebyales bacterium]|nr:ABC transporter ATP-binding protein [Euzebyales bacterium]
MAVLKVEHLHKTFPGGRGRDPNKVLNDINFEVSGQQFVSLVGPSGCGKSTLLNIVSGVEHASGGTVLVLDDHGEPARLGYVFQDPRLLPWRNVMDNMLYVHDDRSPQRREQMVGYLRMVGLDGHTDYFPAQLSGGMQQRVGIARAFGVEPDLLLMDEPFSHLDAITARSLRDQLQDIWAQTKKTVLFVTHDVMEAVQLSDRIIVLAPGGTLYEDIAVDLPRPRKLSDPTVATMQAEILARLERMTQELARSASA